MMSSRFIPPPLRPEGKSGQPDIAEAGEKRSGLIEPVETAPPGPDHPIPTNDARHSAEMNLICINDFDRSIRNNPAAVKQRREK